MRKTTGFARTGTPHYANGWPLPFNRTIAAKTLSPYLLCDIVSDALEFIPRNFAGLGLLEQLLQGDALLNLRAVEEFLEGIFLVRREASLIGILVIADCMVRRNLYVRKAVAGIRG